MSLTHADNQRQTATEQSALPQGWCRLPGLGAIRVAGEERASFLQNMLSNDIHAVNDTTAQLTTQCTPKGRIQALFTVVEQDDAYLLIMPADNLPQTLARLKLFVLRSQVTVEDASDEWTCLGLMGRQAGEALAGAFGFSALPEKDWQLRRVQEILLMRYPGPMPRYLAIASPDQRSALVQRLAQASLPECPADTWTEHDIEAGLPSVHQATREMFVPQWINLDLIGGLNFKKGCYPGQEVVARLHYLGKPNRRMLAGHANLPEIPAPGTPIRDAAGTEIGQIVIATTSSDLADDCQFLAVIKLGQLEQAAFVDGHAVWLARDTLPQLDEQGTQAATTH